jgi:hypothetical protein
MENNVESKREPEAAGLQVKETKGKVPGYLS